MPYIKPLSANSYPGPDNKKEYAVTGTYLFNGAVGIADTDAIKSSTINGVSFQGTFLDIDPRALSLPSNIQGFQSLIFSMAFDLEDAGEATNTISGDFIIGCQQTGQLLRFGSARVPFTPQQYNAGAGQSISAVSCNYLLTGAVPILPSQNAVITLGKCIENSGIAGQSNPAYVKGFLSFSLLTHFVPPFIHGGYGNHISVNNDNLS